jgi:protein arginine N-methyltransferase 5
MYRQTDDRKVWYEWMVEVYALERPTASARPITVSYAQAGSPSLETTAKQNSRAGYRRVRVGMSELHSSIKDGCLM